MAKKIFKTSKIEVIEKKKGEKKLLRRSFYIVYRVLFPRKNGEGTLHRPTQCFWSSCIEGRQFIMSTLFFIGLFIIFLVYFFTLKLHFSFWPACWLGRDFNFKFLLSARSSDGGDRKRWSFLWLLRNLKGVRKIITGFWKFQ